MSAANVLPLTGHSIPPPGGVFYRLFNFKGAVVISLS
jgi:hypothetical protein